MSVLKLVDQAFEQYVSEGRMDDFALSVAVILQMIEVDDTAQKASERAHIHRNCTSSDDPYIFVRQLIVTCVVVARGTISACLATK